MFATDKKTAFYFLLEDNGELTKTDRVIATPSLFAREHFFYVQEVGYLENVKPHTSKRQNLNSFLFFIVLEGEGTLLYKNKQHCLTEGDCVLLDCHIAYAHTSSVDKPWKLMWVHFHGSLASYYYEQFTEYSTECFFHSFSTAFFEQALSALLSLHKEHDALYELNSNKYITDILTASLLECKQTLTHADTSTIVKLKQVREYIDTHFAEKLSLEILSEQFFISKFHLSREFKRYYDATIGTYLLSVRVGAAKQLLRYSRRPIEEIALLCGIPDTSYFTKVFKKSEHMTALEYRKKWTSQL